MEAHKGIPQAYNEICESLLGEPFMVWIEKHPDDLQPGQICEATVNYAVEQRWYLEIADQSDRDEMEWLWKVKEYSGSVPPEPNDRIAVVRHFKLEGEEHLVVAKTKRRPAILIRESLDDWAHPNTPGNELRNWYVVPTFSYRRKHVQEYVECDQKLENPDNFYMPPMHSDQPGFANECAARLHTLQAVPTKHLRAVKSPSAQHEGRQKGYRLTETGLKLLATHFYQSFGMFPELTSDEGLYELLREGIRDLYQIAD